MSGPGDMGQGGGRERGRRPGAHAPRAIPGVAGPGRGHGGGAR
jgi:hypothetical protein